ncbi:unnamed protein product [Spirodela intermedia]|uniref:Uncharacterized protein n=1 Tax=Spirodela intermedia TaxID=51605 RepID=A0ABN7EBV9_SPIIN|nr:unnamed protein product [Spirodela intermedia]
MHFSGLVSLGGQGEVAETVRRLAREEEMAALPRHPSTRSGAASARKFRRPRRAEPHCDRMAHPTVAAVKREDLGRSVFLAAAMAVLRSGFRRDIGGESAFPTSVHGP